MSIKVMAAVWDQVDVDGTMLLLLLALADYSNEAGFSWPSVATLARRIRRGRRQTFQLLAEAERLGLLTRDSGGKRGESKRSNHYRLTIPTMVSRETTGAAHRTGAVDRTGAAESTSTGAVDRTSPVQPIAPKPSGNRQGNHQLTPQPPSRGATRRGSSRTISYDEAMAARAAVTSDAG